MALYGPAESLSLLLTGELPESDALNHLDVLADFVDKLTYRTEVFRPGTHTYDGQGVEAYRDGERYFFDIPDFDWTGTVAALIAEIDAKLWGRVDLMARCIRAGNAHILGTERGRELLAGMLREPTRRQIRAREKQSRDASMVKKAIAAKALMGAPASLKSVSPRTTALEIATEGTTLSPESFERKIFRKRRQK